MSEQSAATNEGAAVPGEVTVESLAREGGWVPPNEYEGREGRAPLTAAEFLKKGLEIRGNMKKRLTDMGTQLSDVKDAMQHLTSHYEKKTKAEIAKVRKELLEKKDQAIELSDKEAVKEVDKELEELKEEEKIVKEAGKSGKKSSGKSAAFLAWEEDNGWYGSDKILSVVAEAAGNEYAVENPRASEKEILEHAAKVVRQEFPHKFKKENKSAPDAVAGATRGKAGARKFTRSDLNSVQLQVMQNMIKAGAPITEEQYITDLAAMGELK
jgi:DNA-binding transcriptional MerR regulator